MAMLTLIAALEPADNGLIRARLVAFPGVVAFADTRDAALDAVVEALGEYLLAAVPASPLARRRVALRLTRSAFCARIGLDVKATSVPYIAGWDAADPATIERDAAEINRPRRRASRPGAARDALTSFGRRSGGRSSLSAAAAPHVWPDRPLRAGHQAP